MKEETSGMNKQDKGKSVENIRQGKRARIEKRKEKQEKKQQITNSEKQKTVMSENQSGLPGFFSRATD